MRRRERGPRRAVVGRMAVGYLTRESTVLDVVPGVDPRTMTGSAVIISSQSSCKLGSSILRYRYRFHANADATSRLPPCRPAACGEN